MADDIQLTAGIDDKGVKQAAQRMERDVKAFATAATRELKKIDKAFSQAGGGTRATSPANRYAGQVALQVQDIAVQLEAGAKASTIIAQQGSQLASIFGPRGAIYGGLIAIGVASGKWIGETIHGTKQIRQEVEAMEAHAQEMVERGTKLVAQAAKSAEIGRRAEDEYQFGDTEAQRLARVREFKRKVRQIEGTEGKNSAFIRTERASFEAQERLVKAQSALADRRRSMGDQQEFGRGFPNTIAGENQRLDKESELIRAREEAEARIADLREQGRDSEIEIAQANLEAAEKLAKVAGTKQNKVAAKAAEQELKSATRRAFVEQASFEKELALVNVRGSSDEKRWKVLKAEEHFLRTVGNNRDPQSEAQATAFRKTAPSANEALKIQQQLALNQAGQSNFLHDRTFGKTQSQIRAQLREEEKGRRAEVKFQKEQMERGGLIDVQRDASGKVVGGRDPITGERVSGGAAQKRMEELRSLLNLKNNAGGTVADATVNELVTAFANEIQKIIAK